MANFCFLTKDTNLSISDRKPENYFSEIEENHPGALASQWIPMDPALWKMDRYLDFLDARKALLAEEANKCFADLLHGETHWVGESASISAGLPAVIGGPTSEAEELQIDALNEWIEAKGLMRGVIAFDCSDPITGNQLAVIDLAWPEGLQQGLTAPVALLLNENTDVLAVASARGFRCFTSIADLKAYVSSEIRRPD